MTQNFQVFLSHNSIDKPVIRQVKQMLEDRDITTWLDEDELQPGMNWMPLLDAAMENCASAAAFVSDNGLGPWEDEEIQTLLRNAVKDKKPVIPVLLPGKYDAPKLPSFLSNRTWIDMRLGINDEVIDKLIWGITGSKPEAPQADMQQSKSIIIDKLPDISGKFIGRKKELEILDKAFKAPWPKIFRPLHNHSDD